MIFYRFLIPNEYICIAFLNKLMRKILILTMAFLLPFFAIEMRADEEVQIKKIPLKIEEFVDIYFTQENFNLMREYYE